MSYPGKSPFPMLPIEDCIEKVMDASAALEVEAVPLAGALGRVLAVDASAARDIPAFPTCILDGFAVRSQDCPGDLAVVDEVTAGAAPKKELAAGQCCYVTTGSQMPAGADAVIQVEDIEEKEKNADGQLVIACRAVKVGTAIRQVGSDSQAGQVLVHKGRKLTAAEIGVLAALGMHTVQCFRRPRVGILSTGDELHDVKDQAQGCQVVDSNRPMLSALALEEGCELVDLGLLRDDYDTIRDKVQGALESVDVIVSSGAVGRGSKDHLKGLLEELGTVHFGEMRMKPGKPTTFATVPRGGRDRLVFALPGNPVSAFATFKLVVLPALRLLSGIPKSHARLPKIQAEVDSDIARDPGRPEWHRVSIRWDQANNKAVASSTGFQRSSRIASIAEANAFLEVPAGSEEVPKGTKRPAVVFSALEPEHFAPACNSCSKTDTSGPVTVGPVPAAKLEQAEAAAFRCAVAQLRERQDVSNDALFRVSGFSRNCLAEWYREAREEAGHSIALGDAQEVIYGQPYDEWKKIHQVGNEVDKTSRVELDCKAPLPLRGQRDEADGNNIGLRAEAGAFRRLVAHFRHRVDIQNIDIMNLAGFCRNCLSKWYKKGLHDVGVEVELDEARELVYGMPYADWKKQYQTSATASQLEAFRKAACSGKALTAFPPNQPLALPSRGQVTAAVPSLSIVVGVVTVSDRASAGVYEDRSGPAVVDCLRSFGWRGWPEIGAVHTELVSDSIPQIKRAVRGLLQQGCTLVVTTGGTGFAQRDVTPEAIQDLLERPAPGLVHAVLSGTAKHNELALLSRPVAGTIGKSLILTVPGSPGAVKECLEAVEKLLLHAMVLLQT